MKLDEQRDWYEGWHDADATPYPVEIMKQQSRIDVIAKMLQQIRFPQSTCYRVRSRAGISHLERI